MHAANNLGMRPTIEAHLLAFPIKLFDKNAEE